MRRQAQIEKEANEELMRQNSALQEENADLKAKLTLKPNILDNIIETKVSDGELKGRRKKSIPKKKKDNNVVSCLYCDFKTEALLTLEEHMDRAHWDQRLD